MPYLASVILIGVALWLRFKIEETPTFRALAAAKRIENAPVVELFRTAWGRLLVGIATYLFASAGFFIVTTFMISYAVRVRGLAPSVILTALTIGAVGQIAGLVGSGKLSDHLGAPRTVAIGYTLTVLLAFPIFWIVDTGNATLITAGYVVFLGLTTISYGPIGALLSQIFAPRLHYSGLALSANFAGLIAGFMPALATVILSGSGNASWGPASLLLAIAAISLLGALAAKRLVVGPEHAQPSAQRPPSSSALDAMVGLD